MKTEVLTRKERERQFRRQEIMDAAETLFAEKGFHGTTLDDIAEAAEFGKGTIYNYFESKEEIYRTIIFDLLEGGTEALKQLDASCEDFIDLIGNHIQAMVTFLLQNPNKLLIYTHEMMSMHFHNGNTSIIPKEVIIEKNRESRAILARRFKQAIDDGILKNMRTDNLLASYVNALYPYLFYLITHSPDDVEFDPEQEARHVTEVIKHGILRT